MGDRFNREVDREPPLPLPLVCGPFRCRVHLLICSVVAGVIPAVASDGLRMARDVQQTLSVPCVTKASKSRWARSRSCPARTTCSHPHALMSVMVGARRGVRSLACRARGCSGFGVRRPCAPHRRQPGAEPSSTTCSVRSPDAVVTSASLDPIKQSASRGVWVRPHADASVPGRHGRVAGPGD